MPVTILIASHLPNLKLIEQCMDAVDRSTKEVPIHFSIGIDGVTKGDAADLELYLRQRTRKHQPNPAGRPSTYQLEREPPPPPRDWEMTNWPTVYFQAIVANTLPKLQDEYLMILPPWIELQDPRWFGKLQQPYMVDPHTMLVAVPALGVPRGTMPPAKFFRRKHPTTEAILTKRSVAVEIAPHMDPVRSVRGWVREFSRVAEMRGGTRWEAPALRYNEIEHEEWLKPERSENQEKRSESPSPTTAASSSPTTTDEDGSGVSVPF